jgi:uncharacterized protein YuzE
MNEPYLEVTFRRGAILAAYLYLPRETGDVSSRTRPLGSGLVVDYSESGRPIGIEILSPALVSLKDINSVLIEIGVGPLTPTEWAPLQAA